MKHPVHLIHQANKLYAVFHQETFDKVFCWYREVEEADKEDMKEIVKVNSKKEGAEYLWLLSLWYCNFFYY